MKPFTGSWRRFSLRSLLLVVTLLCIWLSWQVFLVQQRKWVLTDAKRKLYARVTTAAQYESFFPGRTPPNPVAQVPLIRRWMGDEAIQEIGLYIPDAKDGQLSRLQRWFPEARVAQERPMEPCHPGCFPAGTLVETASGPQAIETIQVGDRLVAFDRLGRRLLVPVTSIFTTRNRLVEVDTPDGKLFTTPTQPLCLDFHQQEAAANLQAGDSLLVWSDGAPRVTTVERAEVTMRVARVFNLVLVDSEIFVAGGFLARSKPPADPNDPHAEPSSEPNSEPSAAARLAHDGS